MPQRIFGAIFGTNRGGSPINSFINKMKIRPKPIKVPEQEPAKEEPNIQIDTEPTFVEEPASFASPPKENSKQDLNPEPSKNLSTMTNDKKETIQNFVKQNSGIEPETKEEHKQDKESVKDEYNQTTIKKQQISGKEPETKEEHKQDKESVKDENNQTTVSETSKQKDKPDEGNKESTGKKQEKELLQLKN
ncbi:hypothetical protein C0J52_09033 [Blattella germanica]|nr:hypothetical protein C0J52_09033 [Blattella germanica]